jgi:hypothetical protein
MLLLTAAAGAAANAFALQVLVIGAELQVPLCSWLFMTCQRAHLTLLLLLLLRLLLVIAVFLGAGDWC